MHATVLAPQVWQRWREARQLVLLATFEDSTTGTRVKEFRQELSRQLGQECRIIEHVWLFNMFRLRELREIAAEEAAAADLILISLHETERLPEDVQAWMDLWLRQKGDRKPLLLALLEPTREGAPRMSERCLRDAAREGGIDFLVESWAEFEGHY
jgi:hypothetical protein